MIFSCKISKQQYPEHEPFLRFGYDKHIVHF
jgi:hypothetical protein